MNLCRSGSPLTSTKPSPLEGNNRSRNTAVALITLGLVASACLLCWGVAKWETLVARADRAEAQLVVTRRDIAKRKQRSAELAKVEAALREEMAQLTRANSELDPHVGIGVSRETIAAAFADLKFLDKEKPDGGGVEHYGTQNLAGSIQLWGPAANLTQIEFFGELKGQQSEASNSMLATLLAAAIPQWDAAQRDSWLRKLMTIEDDILVYREIDRVRVDWHWTSLDGVRLDVLSIQSK